VLVLGLARSGLAAAAALERRDVEVVRADRELGNDADLSLLDGVELMVKSPGVPREAPLVTAAEQRGVPIWSEVELAYRVLPNTIVGVTGTNGKTTTAEWLGFMLDAPVAGNVGRALTELDGAVPPDQLVVCELSSFQLEDIDELRPQVAVLLNLEPDHLDRHDSFEAYRDAKLRIFENQTEADRRPPRAKPDSYGVRAGRTTVLRSSGSFCNRANPVSTMRVYPTRLKNSCRK
jgi:UDP-N-acetylmuramoylalanine--D-glutamate ligase